MALTSREYFEQDFILLQHFFPLTYFAIFIQNKNGLSYS